MVQTFSEAGLTDAEITAAMEKLYNNEKVSSKLNGLVKTATEDYNAQVGRAAAAQSRIDKLEKEWYPAANAEYQRVLGELAQAQQQMQRGGAPPDFDASKYVSREDLARMQQDMGIRFAGVLKDTAKITASHVARFQEEPDLQAIDELAMKQNLPLVAAYEKWIEPRVKEREGKAQEEWKKQQREEIERDVRSRYHLPAESVPTETAPVYNRQSKDDLPKDIDADLLSTWRSVPQKV
jgi:hypothetical protein